MRRRNRLLASCAVTAAMTLTVAACGSENTNDTPSPGQANPASEYCVAQGGEIEIVDNPDGEAGICNLPDGTSIDEWEYFRANNPDVSTP